MSTPNTFDSLSNTFETIVQKVWSEMGQSRTPTVIFDDLGVLLGNPWRKFRVGFWPLKEGLFPMSITVHHKCGALSYEVDGIYGGTYTFEDLEVLVQAGNLLKQFRDKLDIELRRALSL